MSDEYCRCEVWGPGGLNSGPRALSECPVMLEQRALKAPGGVARVRAEYDELCRDAAARADGGPDKAAVNEALHKLGVPVQAIEALAKPRETEALDWARRFDGNALAKMLAYFGPTGTGKTTAGAWVLREDIRRDKGGTPSGALRQPRMFVEARALTRLATFDSSAETWLEAMRNTRLLLLDDLGEEATESGKAAVLDLLLTRLARGRRTVVTSNVRLEALGRRYGAPLVDRLNAQALLPDLSRGKSMRARTA